MDLVVTLKQDGKWIVRKKIYQVYFLLDLDFQFMKPSRDEFS
jgi:hypothetical protein